MTPKDPSGTDALAAELRRIVEQAEELMDAAGAENVTLGGLKDRVNDTIEAAREKLADLQEEARLRGRSAAVAIGAGVGLIVGALLMRSGPSAAPDEPQD